MICILGFARGGTKCHNKAFKTDSQRLAFLVCFEFSVYGTMV
ncbi:hypothetical protein D021_2081 [Vibrio parahaemolyticus 10296]|nr:hypothetical protein D052_3396 [Vibrio parahaemolyticus 10290]ESV68792.1 hypothetical protein D021_2081 [Vibrio parahaemolyticus 10296]EVU21477.1 hypothetical protein D046_0066 [Vibrio parahaemolyticus V-223/04]